MGILNRAPAPIDADRPAAADFVRVLATWAVGAFHIWQQSWYGGAAPAHWLQAGSVGVDLLVMLSAFCLFLPWANAAVRNQPLPRIRPAEFYRRRALRLLPAYYVSLLFSLVLAVARRGWSKALALDLAAHLALTQQFYRPAYLACQLNGVTWTLTVFALFYLVFPLLAPLCAKWPLPTLAALGLVQLGTRAGCCRSTAAETILPGSTNSRRSAGCWPWDWRRRGCLLNSPTAAGHSTFCPVRAARRWGWRRSAGWMPKCAPKLRRQSTSSSS